MSNVTFIKYAQMTPHGIMFHHFHNAQHPEQQGSITQEALEKILNFVEKQRIVNPPEWLEQVRSKSLRNGDICLTFDDALLSQFTIALPILERYKLKAFWFVYSNIFEGSVSTFEVYRTFRCSYFKNIDEFYHIFFKKIFQSEWAEKAKNVIAKTDIAPIQKAYPVYSTNDIHFRLLRDKVLPTHAYENIMNTIIQAYGTSVAELAKNLWMRNEHLKYLHDRGHVIGLHSYTHPMTLAHLPFEVQKKEYIRNYHHLKKILGIAPVAMAHPANSYNDTTLEILKELGIYCGFRANMTPPREEDPLNRTALEFAREDHANIMRMLSLTSSNNNN